MKSGWNGKVLAIQLTESKGGEIRQVQDVRVEKGRGLEGDRYWARSAGNGIEAGQQVTFIESEALAALLREYEIELTAADSRRNVLTEGVPLNHLVGREFRAGECVFRGKKLCEPCGYLQSRTKKGVVKGLRHRGGLRAEVVAGGRLRTGDRIEEA